MRPPGNDQARSEDAQAWNGFTGLTQHELSEDPHDFFFTHLLAGARYLDGSNHTFAAVYLLAHGVLKLVLVAAVLRDKMWAYPWMIAFLLAFIGYQSYRFVIDPTVGMLALTVFDVFVVWLTQREYVKHRARIGGAVS